MVRRRRDSQQLEQRRVQATIRVLTALGERDALLVAVELRAGEAINDLLETGLTISDVVTSWCDRRLSLKDARRLARLAHDHTKPGDGSADDFAGSA
jgi:hypothetical protein